MHNMPRLLLDVWIDAATRAVQEWIPMAIGAEQVRCAPLDPDLTVAFDKGGYIQILTDHETVQMGIGGSHSDCVRLTKQLIGLEDDDADPSDDDIRDALGELANIVAGRMKTFVTEKAGATNVRLGLPFFVEGALLLMGSLDEQTLEVDATTCQFGVRLCQRAGE